ncbi:MAG: TerB family tellurite resistance protein [Woeseia sp.]
MSILEFKNISKIFGGGKPSAEEQKSLYNEALLMTLARATSADTDIQSVEIEAAQKILKKETGEDISAANIRVAAKSSIFESQPLEKYLAQVGNKLGAQHRVRIVHSLTKVLKSDVRVTQFEADFFNMVAKALKVSYADAAGLLLQD